MIRFSAIIVVHSASGCCSSIVTAFPFQCLHYSLRRFVCLFFFFFRCCCWTGNCGRIVNNFHRKFHFQSDLIRQKWFRLYRKCFKFATRDAVAVVQPKRAHKSLKYCDVNGWKDNMVSKITALSLRVKHFSAFLQLVLLATLAIRHCAKLGCYGSQKFWAFKK